MRGLGDYVHYPLIACLPGPSHFHPEHLPWNRPPSSLHHHSSSSSSTRTKGSSAGASNNDDVTKLVSLALEERLVLARSREFPRLAAAAGFAVDGHSSISNSRRSFEEVQSKGTSGNGRGVRLSRQLAQEQQESVALDALLRASGLFSEVRTWGPPGSEPLKPASKPPLFENLLPVPMKVSNNSSFDDDQEARAAAKAIRAANRAKYAQTAEQALAEEEARFKLLMETEAQKKNKKDAKAAKKEQSMAIAEAKKLEEDAERIARMEKKRERAVAEAAAKEQAAAEAAAKKKKKEDAAAKKKRREEEEAAAAAAAELADAERLSQEKEASKEKRRARLKAAKAAEKEKQLQALADEEAREAEAMAAALAAAEAKAAAAEAAVGNKNAALAAAKKAREERAARRKAEEEAEAAAAAAAEAAERERAAQEKEARALAKKKKKKQDEADARKAAEEEQAKANAKVKKATALPPPPVSSVPPRNLGGSMRARVTSTRLNVVKSLADARESLTPEEAAHIESRSDLVYMWAQEDGAMLTNTVKPWPCTCISADVVKLTMPKPMGRHYKDNEQAWGTIFKTFLNTPGTPYRAGLKFNGGKLTAGTGYRSAPVDGRILRMYRPDNVSDANANNSAGGNNIDDDDDENYVYDVVYDADTSGTEPRAGNAAGLEALTELGVPHTRLQTREIGGGIFVGAAVSVLKIVQRTFEFVSGTAAHAALQAMQRHTLGTHASATASASAAANGGTTFKPDARFGLLHNGIQFVAARPITIRLHGFPASAQVLLPNLDSVRKAQPGDSAPAEVPFPHTSKWSSSNNNGNHSSSASGSGLSGSNTNGSSSEGNVDPATVQVWDPQALLRDGMPLRFVNKRAQCSVVYKLCRFDDIDVPLAEPITAASVSPSRNTQHALRHNSSNSSGGATSVGAFRAGSFTHARELSPENEGEHLNLASSRNSPNSNSNIASKSDLTTSSAYESMPVVVYVRPGELAWVRAPPGVYHLRVAEGRLWFGDEFMFGPSAVAWSAGAAPEEITSPTASSAASAAAGTGAGADIASLLEEPFANYGTSKWQYAPCWLYRSRGGRWVITTEDPSGPEVLAEEVEDAMDEEYGEQQRHRQRVDHGLFRTATTRLDWPHLEDHRKSAANAAKGWQVNRSNNLMASVDDDNDTGNSKWDPFPDMSVAEDLDSGAPLSSDSSNSSSSGPVGLVVKDLPLLVGGRGTFLRVATAEGRRASLEMTREMLFGNNGGGGGTNGSGGGVGGMSSSSRTFAWAAPPLLVNGAPVYKYDPRYQFLVELYASKEGDRNAGGRTGGQAGAASKPRSGFQGDPAAFLAAKQRGRAGPIEGSWWWDLRNRCPNAGSFARAVLEALEEEVNK